eukprot:gene15645-17224_t
MESSVGDEHYRRQKLSPDELFGLFSDTTGFEENLKLFEDLLDSLQINKNEHREIYPKLKTKLTSWKCQSLWDLIDSRGSHAEYEKGKVCSHLNVLVIGAGPIGLRTAIETAFLGCKTVIVEKRTCFTRNNVLHLWPFLLTDFRALGAKKFYGKFCAGSIDHISIKQLQNILLKICLILGVKIIPGTEFKELVEPAEGKGWKGLYSPQRDFLTNFQFDVIIGADGKKDVLPGFPQIEMRGALAIGITCNFVNENTMAEAGIEEISGIAYQFNPKFFDDLKEQFNVGLENIVYYKDETHYFVMTILKSSLLKRGALKQDFSDPSKLLDKQNIDDEKLLNLTLDTVHYATNYQLPPHLKLASNPNGSPDIAVFDFTSLKKASNACRMMERKGKRLLITLVGDSLLQPFWPTGSGCGRGVLSSLDTAWMIRLFGMNKAPLTVLWEREKIFKLLSGTNSEHLQKNYKSFTIDPKTRYANLNHSAAANVAFLKKLYDTDDPDNADFTLPENIIAAKFEVGRATTLQLPRSKRKSIGKRRSHSAINHKRRSDRTTLKDAKHVSKAKAAWESKIPKGTGISGASKRTRPSESRSGSSGLSSLSESDREEPVGPYQRAMSLRKRNQSSEQSEVFSTSTASSTEALDVFDDSHRVLLHDNKQPRVDVQHHRVLGHKHAHAHTSGDRLAYKHGGQDSKHNGNHGKSGGGVMRFLFGRGKTADAGEHHDAHREKRKSVAARKSLSRARRLRRRSGATSSQSKSEDEENLLLLKQRQGGLQSVTIRKRPNRHQVQNEETKASDKPSAKELIAAAEERDMRSAIEGTSSKSESLKRKADQMKDESKTATSSRLNNVAWKHCLPAVEPLLTDDNKDGGQEEGAVVESLNSLKNASQLAGLLLLAVPLLLPCSADNTLTINTGNKPRNMFAEKKNAFSRTSTEKMETKKISIKRAGSVQKAVQNWNKSKQEDAPTQDFNDFKRNRSSGSLKKDGSFAGQRWSFHGRPSEDMQRPPSLHNPVNMDDYEIIEMKGGGNLQPKEVIDLNVIDETRNASTSQRGVLCMTKKIFNTLLCLVVSIVFVLIVIALSVHFIFV